MNWCVGRFAPGQEMARGKNLQGQGILFRVRENWQFEEKSRKIKINLKPLKAGRII